MVSADTEPVELLDEMGKLLFYSVSRWGHGRPGMLGQKIRKK
jgi:hypothetical protein